MRKVDRPFFLFNPKSYFYGDKLLELAVYADEVGRKLDITTFVSAPYSDISRVASSVKSAIVTAQGMDGITPGRGMGAVLPESLKAAGAEAVVLNHAERPLSIAELVKAHKRAKELDMITIVCADSAEEAALIALLHPDIMICEPTSLIGTGVTSDTSYMTSTNEAVHKYSPDTLILQAAGISTGEDVYNAIKSGGDGSGATSGITEASDPKQAIYDMIEACDRARREGF